MQIVVRVIKYRGKNRRPPQYFFVKVKNGAKVRFELLNMETADFRDEYAKGARAGIISRRGHTLRSEPVYRPALVRLVSTQ